jgi:comEA protein
MTPTESAAGVNAVLTSCRTAPASTDSTIHFHKGVVMVHRMFGIGAVVVMMLAVASGAQAQAAGTRPSTEKAAKPTAASPVNLNTASSAELQGLPGVGPSMAGRILEYRQKNGGFKKIEDLMNVKGIGEKSFLKLKPLVTVTPAKTTER